VIAAGVGPSSGNGQVSAVSVPWYRTCARAIVRSAPAGTPWDASSPLACVASDRAVSRAAARPSASRGRSIEASRIAVWSASPMP